jgi:hypothetical protein
MACEKCWADAHTLSYHLGGTVSTHYSKLIKERNVMGPCTPEEQCGSMHAGAPNCACQRAKKQNTNRKTENVNGKRNGQKG